MEDTANLTEKIDIWSAGCIIYELVSLKKAFNGQNWIQIHNNINMSDPELDISMHPNRNGYEKIKFIVKRYCRQILV